MDEPVPIITSLDALYPSESLVTQMQRWDRLYRHFASLYHSSSPQFVARSPGRVNILGEHIDYSLYEVLPMAILADVLIAVSTSTPSPDSQETTILISNIDSEKYPSTEFGIPSNGEIEIDPSNHSWTNYFKAGCKGAVSLLRKQTPDLSLRSMSILVDGNVPAGSGLSSSAAFVCASALAVLRANGQSSVIKKQLVELAIVSERSVGVNSGGMDRTYISDSLIPFYALIHYWFAFLEQMEESRCRDLSQPSRKAFDRVMLTPQNLESASVFSVRGDALSVSFSPELHAEAIAFPKLDPPITFMIAQSFVVSDKHVTAPERYNLRVVECTLAADVLAAALKLKLEDDAAPLGRSLRGFQTAYYSPSPSSPGDPSTPYKTQLETMLQLISTHLSNPSGYTHSDIASLLSISPTEVKSRYLTAFPVRASTFHLAHRATHVFSEALRVLAFKSLLLTSPPPSGLLPQLGALMTETQISCREAYDCSCAELDQLCEIAREAGTYGGRLTGAGWGGCTVHLVPKGKVEEVRKAWVERYYKAREPGISEERLREAIVVSEPGQGSAM
ncbi:MAG: galactokinase [Heterodermia speciosa]|uniref:Galactokinase n=1 Tax=Heterodermia speciosa TaxID=116794 RepID=A0A8H3G236_9LECA|nr:MAG: galactokinase [Heterodermia speciosa]